MVKDFFKGIAKDYRKSLALGFVEESIRFALQSENYKEHLEKALSVLEELYRVEREEE